MSFPAIHRISFSSLGQNHFLQSSLGVALLAAIISAPSVANAQGFPGAPMTRPPSPKVKASASSNTAPAPAPKAAPSAPQQTPSTEAAAAESPQERNPLAEEPNAETTSAESEFDGGLYFHLGGAALFSPNGSTHSWGTDGCPSLSTVGLSWTPQCATKAPIGGAISARLGFRYRWFGFEVLGIGAGDWSSASYDQPVPGVPTIAQSMQVGRIGGGPGAGIRFMTSPSTFRLSAGLGAGALFRYVFTSFSSLDGSSTNYVAPALVSDFNLLIGPLSIGVMALVEFANDVNIATNLNEQIALPPDSPIDVDEAFSPIRVFTGTQFFLGPVIGLHFGE